MVFSEKYSTKISSVLLSFYLEVCVLKIKRAKLNLRTKIFDGGGHGAAWCYGTMFYAWVVRSFLRGKPLGQIRNFAEIPGLRSMTLSP